MLEDCSNTRKREPSPMGIAAQMEPRRAWVVYLSSPHVFVRSLHTDTERKKSVRGEWRFKWPL